MSQLTRGIGTSYYVLGTIEQHVPVHNIHPPTRLCGSGGAKRSRRSDWLELLVFFQLDRTSLQLFISRHLFCTSSETSFDFRSTIIAVSVAPASPALLSRPRSAHRKPFLSFSDSALCTSDTLTHYGCSRAVRELK